MYTHMSTTETRRSRRSWQVCHPPSISRVNPSSASPSFAPSENIDFTVDVSDSDGDLERVDYYIDGSLITDVAVSGSSDRATWQRLAGECN